VRNGFRLAYGLKGMPKPGALHAYGQRWAPYRSAAAWYLWRAVDLHKDGKLPKRIGRAPRIEIEKPKAAGKKAAPKAASKAKAKTKKREKRKSAQAK
jgi:hypothetical protein